MKKFFSNTKFMLVMILILISMSYVLTTYAAFGEPTIPFSYNLLPEVKNYSAIDKQVTKALRFQLYENVEDIYYNNQKMDVIDDAFEIDISAFSGKTTFTFQNAQGHTAQFTYYISDDAGRLEGFVSSIISPSVL